MESRHKIRLGTLQKIYDIGKKISLIDQNKRATTIRAAQAEKVVEKVLLHCGSIVKLLSIDKEDYAELDIALVASAARNIIDSANIYFYVSERGISEEEVNLRYNMQILNYYKNIKNIFGKLDFSLTSSRMRLIDAENIRNEIKNSKIYLQADSNERSLMLSGKQFINKPDMKILDYNIESGIYNLLSNSTHSFYIGLSNNSLSKSGIFASYIDFIMLAIIAVETAIIYTANIINDYMILRKKLGKKLSENERVIVKSLMEPDYIYEYLEHQKDFFDGDIINISPSATHDQ